MSSKKFVASEVNGVSPGVLDPSLYNEIEGWISKIVDPAYRLIAGGATRLLPSIFSSSISHSSTSTLPHTVPPSNVANHVAALISLHNGITKKLSLSRNVICSKCKGKGSKSGASMKCPGCQGSGMKISVRQLGPSMIQQMQHPCSECKGTGESISDRDRCPQCKDQFKGINDEGMPMYQRPFMRRKLYSHFTVDFPGSLTLEQCKALELVLPPRTSMQLTNMELDECEETTLHDVNIEAEMRRKQSQAQQEAYEEDDLSCNVCICGWMDDLVPCVL
ncbi:hypothetical protein Nepgr_021316 [Nepenthes gracilis]|uniref:CR-type domain-containing protein n=1 Tax=Nepenthes gracilis TaxID=150966 RepID=A0AAD3SX57_NEPGR|nr:hypothetical protein Nepgr_021316 [Nepenthes gracilis]